jgi:hypothetical protein
VVVQVARVVAPDSRLHDRKFFVLKFRNILSRVDARANLPPGARWFA